MTPSFPAIDMPTLQQESLPSPIDATLIGAIVGGSLGGIFLIALTAIICVAVRRRRHRQEQGSATASDADMKSMPSQPSPIQPSPIPQPTSKSTVYTQLGSESEYSAADLDLHNRNSRYDDARVLRADAGYASGNLNNQD
jgi:hypothetical protein